MSRAEISRLDIQEGGTGDDGALVLRLLGSLDVDSAPGLYERLTQLLGAGSRRLELDCRALVFMSSVGVGTLVAAVGDFRAASGDLVVSGLKPELRFVLEMLGLLDYITVR